MKRYIFSLFVALCAFSGYAWDFTAQDNKGVTWYFDWVKPGITCQLADRNDIRAEYNPNANSWESPYNIIYIPTNTVVTSSNAWSMPVENTLNWGNNTIPEEITTIYNEKTVTVKVIGIGKYCFAIGGYVQGAPKIPSSIEYIGEGAFLNMNQSGEIDLSNVKSIGKLAFCYSGLSGINVSNVEYIGDYAFYQAGAVTYINLGEKCKHIGDYAFYMCSNLEELEIPGTCKYVGAYSFYHCENICPLTLNEGIEEIGAFAFYEAHWTCSHRLDLPSTLKKIGVWAFMFNRTADTRETDTDITDIYIYATTPPELPTGTAVDKEGKVFDDMCAWGDSDPSIHFWDADGWWMFPYLCLHVPAGSYNTYKTDPYWGKFSCIIDDITTESSDDIKPRSIQEFVGYVFLQNEPNTKGNPSTDLNVEFSNRLPEEIKNGKAHIDWKRVDKPDPSEQVISIDGSVVTGEKLGQQLVLGYSDDLSYVFEQGTMKPQKEQLVAAVMVFVCPTITLVYDTSELEQSISTQNISRVRKVADGESGASDYDKEIEDFASYQHRGIYNSYPKFKIDTPEGIEVTTLKGHFDESGGFVDDGKYGEGLIDLEPENQVGVGSDTDANDYIVPLSSITENHMFKVSLMALTDDFKDIQTGVEETKISDTVTIRTVGRMLSINGADEDAVVRVYNLNGQLIKTTTDKQFGFSSPGVYIIKVGEDVFKASVR